jgi:hypothetical protein
MARIFAILARFRSFGEFRSLAEFFYLGEISYLGDFLAFWANFRRHLGEFSLFWRDIAFGRDIYLRRNCCLLGEFSHLTFT